MIKFETKRFEELSLHEFYNIMVLRQEVFVVEQDCPYLDADGKDQAAWHLIGKNEPGEIIAYLRILPKGITYEKYPSLGRVVTSSKVRGNGTGKKLMKQALAVLKKLFPDKAVKISAQTYLLKFYQSFDFEAVGEEYLEDGIPHIGMIRKG